jgi:RNA polymerase sigma factor (sigma-70 family)
MREPPFSTVVSHLRGLTVPESVKKLSDAQLLERYASRQDHAAFTVLVQRHARLVWAVCRNTLRHQQDAEDALQASFLVLATRASSIKKSKALASWLHGVAFRTAMLVKRKAAVQRIHERKAGTEMATSQSDSESAWRDLLGVLDEEVRRLPESYAAPFVLCCLEGRSGPEAARQLGWPEGTVATRLARARKLLQARLLRRGIDLTLVLAGLSVAYRAAPAAGMIQLAVDVLQGAELLQAGKTASGVLSSRAVDIAYTVAKAMFLAKLKFHAVLVMAISLLAAPMGMGAWRLASLGTSDYANHDAAIFHLVPQKQPIPATDNQAAVDGFGDALPDGAVSRLGTVRWRHGGQCGFVALLPDGKQVLTAGGDNAFHLWEYPSGKEIRRFGVGTRDVPDLPDRGHMQFLRGYFLPAAMTADGKTVAGDLDGSGIRLYEVATGNPLPPLQRLGENGGARAVGATALAFSPDGRQLASIDDMGTTEIWDVASLKELKLIATPAEKKGNRGVGGIPVIAYAPDGKSLLTIRAELAEPKGSTSFACLWNPDAGQEIWKVPLGEKGTRLPVDFSPDSQRLALASGDGSIIILNVADGKQLGRFQEKNADRLTVLFSPNGKTLFSYDLDATVAEWNVETGEKRRVLGAQLPRRKGTLYGGDLSGGRMSLSSDGATLALCGTDNTPHFLDLKSGNEIAGTKAPAMAVQSLQFTTESNKLWTRTAANTVALDQANINLLWDLSSGKELRMQSYADSMMGDQVSPDGKYVVTQTRTSAEIQVYDTAANAKVSSLPPRKLGDQAEMSITPDGKTLILRWFRSQTIESYDFPALKLKLSLSVRTGAGDKLSQDGRQIAPATVIVSPDSQRLAAYDDARTLAIWDLSSGKKLFTLQPPTGMAIHNGAFTPDGRCLALNLNDGVVSLYELATMKVRHEFGEKAPPPNPRAPGYLPGVTIMGLIRPNGHRSGRTTAVSPDGKVLANGGLDRKLHLWDLVSCNELAGFTGHSGTIRAVAFAPDGKLLASASDDTTTLVWDMTKVKAAPLTKRSLSASELTSRWNQLTSEDAAAAFQAIRELVGSPKETVSFLAERLKPSLSLDEKLVEKLVADLDSADFKTRQYATAELMKFAEPALPAIQKALAGQPPLETKQRLEALQAKFTNPLLTDEKLRLCRALEVLERIGSPDARQLLRLLADGAPGTYLTTTARVALMRLKP